MDLLSLHYFAELAKDLHITKTANRLFISQQTLSNHIQRLESYFGTQLLYRRPALSLTYAGEFVLAYAKVMEKEEINLKDILSDIAQQESGVLRIGGSVLRLTACMPHILPAFSERYPNVELRLTTDISNGLEPRVLNGDLDFAIIFSQECDPALVEQPLQLDQIYLCVREGLLRRYYGEQADEIKRQAVQGATFKPFEKLPFCVYYNRLGRELQRCIEEEKATLRPYLTTEYTQICLNAGLTGSAAFFAPQVALASQPSLPDDLNVFPFHVDGTPMTQKVSLIRHRQRYLTHYSKYFQELLFRYFSEVEQKSLVRCYEPRPSQPPADGV